MQICPNKRAYFPTQNTSCALLYVASETCASGDILDPARRISCCLSPFLTEEIAQVRRFANDLCLEGSSVAAQCRTTNVAVAK